MAFPGRNNSQKSSDCNLDNTKINQMVKDRAYYIWLGKGKPAGQDTTIWLQAEKEIRSKIKK